MRVKEYDRTCVLLIFLLLLSFSFCLFLNQFFREPYIKAINLLYHSTSTHTLFFFFTNYHLSFDFFIKEKGNINNFNSYKFKFLIFPPLWHLDVCCLKCQILSYSAGRNGKLLLIPWKIIQQDIIRVKTLAPLC